MVGLFPPPSKNIDILMKKIKDEVRAADIVNELLNVHPEYAEGEAKGFSVEGGPDKRPVVEWLHEAYSLYEEIKANEMDDRNVIFGLILLDNNLTLQSMLKTL